MRSLIYLVLYIYLVLLYVSVSQTLMLNPIENEKLCELKFHAYPFIPDADNFYQRIETDFENLYPSIDLKIIRSEDYYDETKGIQSDDSSDVYEIDCVLLQTFINRGLIQTFDTSLLDTSDLVEPAKAIVQSNKGYFLPHWICSNFLFYKSGDTDIAESQTLRDLINVIKNKPKLKKSLLIDLTGDMTLGGLYAKACFDEAPNTDLLIKQFNRPSIDSSVLENLKKLPLLTYNLWGRDTFIHSYKQNFYAHQFSKGNGRVYVGYSESFSSVLYDVINGCSADDTCIDISKIEIKNLNLSDSINNKTLGWVDGLTIRKGLEGIKLQNAQIFLNYLVGRSAYYLALIPTHSQVPRYLLPAHLQYYNDSNIIRNAPLYTKFLPLLKNMTSVTSDSLCTNLKRVGNKIDKHL